MYKAFTPPSPLFQLYSLCYCSPAIESMPYSICCAVECQELCWTVKLIFCTFNIITHLFFWGAPNLALVCNTMMFQMINVGSIQFQGNRVLFQNCLNGLLKFYFLTLQTKNSGRLSWWVYSGSFGYILTPSMTSLLPYNAWIDQIWRLCNTTLFILSPVLGMPGSTLDTMLRLKCLV